MSRYIPLALITAAILAVGCQEYAEPSLTPAQKKKVEQHILTTAPTPQVLVGAIVEDQIKLIGYDVSKKKVKPGESITVTYYLESLKEKLDDNKIFVHFQGRKNDRKAWMNLDHHPVDGLMPLRQLKKGQIVKDVQTFTVAKNFPGPEAHIYWGMWRGDYRLKFKDPGQNSKVESDGRLKLGRVEVDAPASKPPAPAKLATAFAYKLPAGATITADGKLDETAWAAAKWTSHWTPPNGKPGKPPKTRARFMWNDTHLFIGVEAVDDDVWSSFKDRDSNTWEQEVIEVFIDADGDKKDYLELQVTPANVVFDAKFEKHRSDLAKARAWNMEGLQTGVSVDGTVNQRDDTDKGYSVEFAIPIAQVPGAPNPPAHGNTWRINLFRWDLPKSGRQVASAFSPPIIGDFHALNKFGRLRFVDPAKVATPKIRPGPGVTPLIKPALQLDPARLEKLKSPDFPIPSGANPNVIKKPVPKPE